MTTDRDLFVAAWQRFLVETVLLKEHATYYVMLNARPGLSNPIVDRFGPGILYVNMVALLDEALALVISERDPTASLPTLNARINYLDSRVRLANAGELHRIRDRRNALAHESGTFTSWDELAADSAILHAELKHLGLVGDRPLVQGFAERSSADFNHGLPGVSHLQHYVVGAKLNGQVVAELSWSLRTYQLGWDEEKVKAALERGEVPPSGI